MQDARRRTFEPLSCRLFSWVQVVGNNNRLGLCGVREGQSVFERDESKKRRKKVSRTTQKSGSESSKEGGKAAVLSHALAARL